MVGWSRVGGVDAVRLDRRYVSMRIRRTGLIHIDKRYYGIEATILFSLCIVLLLFENSKYQSAI